MGCQALRALLCAITLLVLTQHVSAQDDVKVTAAVFAKGFDDNGRPDSPGSRFAPKDKIVLKASLNSRPAKGAFSCTFWLDKQKITTVSVDLSTLNADDLPEGVNAFGVFSLTPTEPFPVSDKYRADLSFDGKPLGTYEFSVVAEDKPAPSTPMAGALPTKKIVDVLLAGTGHVEGESGNGQGWTGTAFLIDKQRRLLVTNDHVANAHDHGDDVDDVESLVVYFPAYRDGHLIHDAAYYAKNVTPVRAKVLWGDQARDLALMQVESMPERMTEISLAKASAGIGDQLHSLGGIPQGSQGLWIYTSGTTRAVYRRNLATGYEAQTLEADMSTNKGNSGGPVINDLGQLVGVVEGHRTDARSVSMYIDLSEVRAFLEESLPLVDPETIDQWTKRGENHFEAGRYQQCLEDFTQVLKQDPKNAYAMSSRGWVFYETGDLETALTAFNDAIQADPTMLYAYRGRGLAALDSGEYDQAKSDFTRAISSSTDKADLAEMYNDRGVASFQLEQYEAAIKDFDRSVDANEDFAQAYANRGDAYLRLGNLEGALLSLAKAVELEPDNLNHYVLMGDAALAAQNTELALKSYTVAVDNAPDVVPFRQSRAKCYRQVQQHQNAINDLLAAINQDPENPELFNDLGLTLYEIEKYSEAYAQFKAASAFAPDNSLYWYNRGESAQKFGDHGQAVKDLTQAISLLDDPDAYAVRGKAYDDLGETQKAINDYDQAAKLAPDAYHKHESKFLAISNQTKEPLKVFVQYYAIGRDGIYYWYPSKTKMITFDFAPGETANVFDGKHRIHGRRFHIWAEGTNSGNTYDEFRENDLTLVSDAGYLSQSKTQEAETFSFVE